MLATNTHKTLTRLNLTHCSFQGCKGLNLFVTHPVWLFLNVMVFCCFFLHASCKTKTLFLEWTLFFLGQRLRKQKRVKHSAAWGRVPSPYTQNIINRACTDWKGSTEVASSYNILSFKCVLPFTQQTAIILEPFSFPPLEKRDNILYVSLCDKPLQTCVFHH